MRVKNDLEERLFRFAVNVMKYLKTLPPNIENNVIRYQLSKSASSSGANYEASQAGASRADFHNKVEIALKEMRESNYWLRMCDALEPGDKEMRKALVQESGELKNILGTIASKTSK
ncbi:MAG: four helix bundle protein [Saprospiraceae bacterium]|nr:four helix bundle protein [Saprospiraceae bacterium]MCF8251061.1 four helix bundle protein [Saprospiraceae bacterium]MCF8280346.1 four helix bundle protein [Bacteroidales bacterium]MCF8312883.1 four helix bundle protein [Saprospiraceae bacterium]MCF8441320.1 four helix bundle protein [Saprospiraceae bacterium]